MNENNDLNESMDLKDCPPQPILYLETEISAKDMEEVISKFQLSCEPYSHGYLLRSEKKLKNFKYSFLDLFFAALYVFKKKNDIHFFLFEKNELRENLELGILNEVQPETLWSFQFDQWKKSQEKTSVSGLAGFALQQAGVLDESQSDQRRFLTPEVLLSLLNQIYKQKYRYSA